MSGTRLVAALVTILLLTFVVPPLAARHVHQQRIAAAEADVARIAEEFAVPSGAAGAARLFHGPGAIPRSAPEAAWLAGISAAPLPGFASPLGPDPWGNHYVVSITGHGAVCVLSAGPNGIVETPNPSVAPPHSAAPGDDVVACRTPPLSSGGVSGVAIR